MVTDSGTPPESEDESGLPEGSLLAAIDLGSNSFHMIVARVEHGEMRPVERIAEKVQLGAGLINGRLDEDAIERGLACLSRLAQALEHIEPDRIRCVGTNALRQAKNRRDFTVPAREILGTRVEVIYGREEARLVYLGVAHTLADDAQSRLVVDIGGGSTEFIVGERFEPQRMESLQMGCVSFGRNYFPDGKINKRNYLRAYEAARVETSHIRYRYSSDHWRESVGSSGTLNTIAEIIQANDWGDGTITHKGLKKLEKHLLNFDCFDDIEVAGLGEHRKSVILPGVAITLGLFKELGMETLQVSKGALREGVIYDLLGRLSHEDVRERTISAMMQRYGVDTSIADTVERRAKTLFWATRNAWQLTRADGALLAWSARTHEMGMAISHKHYNRHTAYLLLHADLPGFSQDEQEYLAFLATGLRRKLSVDLLQSLPAAEQLRLLRMLTLLRLATLFKYTEQLASLPDFSVQAGEQELVLQFPCNWLEQHPLTAQELEQERGRLGKLGMSLIVK